MSHKNRLKTTKKGGRTRHLSVGRRNEKVKNNLLTCCVLLNYWLLKFIYSTGTLQFLLNLDIKGRFWCLWDELLGFNMEIKTKKCTHSLLSGKFCFSWCTEKKVRCNLLKIWTFKTARKLEPKKLNSTYRQLWDASVFSCTCIHSCNKK